MLEEESGMEMKGVEEFEEDEFEVGEEEEAWKELDIDGDR